MRRIVAISDYCDTTPLRSSFSIDDFQNAWDSDTDLGPPKVAREVTGGYLERLPLAAVASGLVDAAEV